MTGGDGSAARSAGPSRVGRWARPALPPALRRPAVVLVATAAVVLVAGGVKVAGDDYVSGIDVRVDDVLTALRAARGAGVPARGLALSAVRFHYPTDTGGGACAAVIVVLGAALLLDRLVARRASG